MVVYSLFMASAVNAQNCNCNNSSGYQGSQIYEAEKDSCKRICIDLINRISFCHKYFSLFTVCDNNALCLMQEDILEREIVRSSNTSNIKVGEDFISYFKQPNLISFRSSAGYYNETYMIDSIRLQQVIIHNDILIQGGDSMLYHSCDDCRQYIHTDTAYIVIQKETFSFVGSRVYLSDISGFIRKDILGELDVDSKVNKSQFRMYRELYKEILDLRHIRYSIKENRNCSKFIIYRPLQNPVEIDLTRRNVKGRIKGVIKGGKFERVL